LIHRRSDSANADGLEFELEGGWTTGMSKWQSDVHLGYRTWSRDQSVNQITLGATWKRFFEAGTFSSSLELEDASSDDDVMDYQRASFEMGWEVQW
jgi:hypothetical protein